MTTMTQQDGMTLGILDSTYVEGGDIDLLIVTRVQIVHELEVFRLDFVRLVTVQLILTRAKIKGVMLQQAHGALWEKYGTQLIQ